MDTDFIFELQPSYSHNQLVLRRLNAPAPPAPQTPAYSPLPPLDLSKWLQSRGWAEQGDIFQHELHGAFTWEQAVAIEFYKFINIGMDR